MKTLCSIIFALFLTSSIVSDGSVAVRVVEKSIGASAVDNLKTNEIGEEFTSWLDLALNLWIEGNPYAPESQQEAALDTLGPIVLSAIITGNSKTAIAQKIIEGVGAKSASKGFFLSSERLVSMLSNLGAFVNPRFYWDFLTGNLSNISSYFDLGLGIKSLAFKYVLYNLMGNLLRPVAQRALNTNQQKLLARWMVHKGFNSGYIAPRFDQGIKALEAQL